MQMPEWCLIYRQPPREFWQLTMDEYDAMMAYAREYVKAMGHL